MSRSSPYKANYSGVNSYVVLGPSEKVYIVGSCKDTREEFRYCNDLRSDVEEHWDYRDLEVKR